MIGSEVGHYLNYMKGALYKKYPSLWRRCPTLEERRKLLCLEIGYKSMSNSNIMLVKASEIETILRGLGEQYKERPAAGSSLGDEMSPRPALRRSLTAAGPSQSQIFLSRETIHSSVQHLNAVSYQSKMSTRPCRRVDLKVRQHLSQKVLPSLG